MKVIELLNKVDHTLLSQTAKWNDIKLICDEGINCNVASVCIPPSYIEQAKHYVGNKLKICTVIGFPNGYNTTSIKMREAEEMVRLGANEIDMVINIGWVKDKKYDDILNEISVIKKSIGDKILKVIVETCFLARDEKINMCKTVIKSGADFIKTSTGFGGAGAMLEDIVLFKNNVDDKIKIKASGGISSLEDAKKFINAGADRLGTSKIVKLVEKLDKNQKL